MSIIEFDRMDLKTFISDITGCSLLVVSSNGFIHSLQGFI